MATIYARGRIYKIDVGALQPDPNQPRTFMAPGALTELTDSIRKYGVLEPILFRRDEGGNLFIVAGERRVEAARRAGLTTIPAIYVESANHQEISLVENILREDLTAVEQAEALEQLMVERNYNQIQLSEMIGKSQSHINEILAINRLPLNVRDQCRTNPNIPKYILTEIAKDKTEAGMTTKFEKYMAQQAAKEQPKQTTARLRKELVLIRQVDALNGKMVNLRWQDWKIEDQEDLAVVLGDIRQTAENILQTMREGNEDEGEEEPNEESGTDDESRSGESKPRLS